MTARLTTCVLAACAVPVLAGAPRGLAAQHPGAPTPGRAGSGGSGVRAPAPQAGAAHTARAEPGFRFTVDTVGETGPNAGVLAPVRGTVTVAAGRGRFDVLAVPRRLTLAVRGVRVAAPRAAPGDYYLFDGAGVVLVRPAARTFTPVALADASYNYEERRDGWPAAFPIDPARPDTVREPNGPNEGPGGAASQPARAPVPGDVPVYWHLDLMAGPPSPPVRILARGRLRLRGAPAGEASLARWFGAAEALATLPGGVAALRGAPLRVTAVVALQPPGSPGAGDTAAVAHLVTLTPLTDLAPVAVDASRLVLPPDYVEVSAEGSTGSPSGAARWRTLPPAAVASGRAPATPDATVRAALGSVYEAVANADTAALRYWLADDLAWTDGVSGAEFSKGQVLSILGGRRVQGLPPRTDRDSVRVDTVGGVAFARFRRVDHRPLGGVDLPTRWRVLDAFATRGGRWQLVRHAQTWLVAPVTPVPLDSAAQQAFVGRYEAAPGIVDDVHWAGGRLVATLTGFPPGAALVPVGASVFSPDGTGALIAFERDTSGRVVGYVQGYPDGRVLRRRKLP